MKNLPLSVIAAIVVTVISVLVLLAVFSHDSRQQECDARHGVLISKHGFTACIFERK